MTVRGDEMRRHVANMPAAFACALLLLLLTDMCSGCPEQSALADPTEAIKRTAQHKAKVEENVTAILHHQAIAINRFVQLDHAIVLLAVQRSCR
jgi:hypothetical protein